MRSLIYRSSTATSSLVSTPSHYAILVHVSLVSGSSYATKSWGGAGEELGRSWGGAGEELGTRLVHVVCPVYTLSLCM